VSGFSTEALLYPLTKGDLLGHPFRGNQYKTGETGAAEEKIPRPPQGQFQLNENEVNEIVALYQKVRGEVIPTSPEYADRLLEAKDAVAVRMAQMLGMDKPATRVDKDDMATNPDLYRGCSLKGAESLTEKLTHYGINGGAMLGSGVYTTNDKRTASVYANSAELQGEEGTVASIWIDPNARILQYLDAIKLPVAPDFATNSRDFGSAIGNPSTLAMAWGYQGYSDISQYEKSGATVILDRSIMKVAY